MSFRSIYRHGPARIAACTTTVSIADPRTNAKSILRVARQCHDRSAALAVFPELCLSGYAIDDLLKQDPLLDAVEAGCRHRRGFLGPDAVLIVGAPLRFGNRIYNCAVVIHRGKSSASCPRLPADLSRILRGTPFRLRRRIVGEVVAVWARMPPFGTDLLFAADDLHGFLTIVEICEDMWVPVTPAVRLALAGASVLINLSASHDHDRQGRLARAAVPVAFGALPCGLCLFRRRGRANPPPIWPGTARPRSTRTACCWPRASGSGRTARSRSPTSTSTCSGRSALRWARSTTIAGSAKADRSAGSRFALTPPAGDSAASARSSASRSCRPTTARSTQDCYEAYNIQVAGLVQRLRATGTKRVVIGVSGGLDSTHALIVAAKAVDLLGLPRANILAYTMPGFATGSETKTNALALMKALQVTRRRSSTSARGDADAEGHRPSLRQRASRSTTSPSRTCRRACAPTICSGSPTITAASSSAPAISRSSALGWCTYGVGDQMAHYNVNAGVPKTLIQHLIRWVIASNAVRRRRQPTLGSILATEISPELVPVERRREAAEHRGLGRALRAAGFQPVLHAALRLPAVQDRVPGAAGLGGRRRGRVAAGISRPTSASAYDLAEIRRWLEVFLRRFFAFSQFKRSAMPNGPKVSAGGSLSPRGDWRAPSDASAAAWLEELERNVPNA